MGRIQIYEENEINEWLNSAVLDTYPGYQILNDNEIVGEIQDEKEIEENENDPGLSHKEAFECLETAMKWLERQKKADPIQLTYLRRISDTAALKRMSSLKQATIESFFAYIIISGFQKMIKREEKINK